MSQPKIGMRFEDVRKKVKGPLGKDSSLRASLLRQVKLAEGEPASRELETELSVIKNRTHSFSGSGSKQVGFGEGKRLGQGKWQYLNGKWIQQ